VRIALSFPGCHRRGGVERIMLECANYLSARGHDLSVLASDLEEESIAPTITRCHVRVPGRLALLRLAEFRRKRAKILRQLHPQPDVHVGFGVVGPPGAVLWVQSVHRAWIEISSRHRSFVGRAKQRANVCHPYILSLEEKYFAGRQYAKLIALSDQVKADLIRFYRVPAQDILILPNGFAPAEFNLSRRLSMRSEMRSRLNYPSDAKVIVFVANELERKGFWPLLSAIASLNDPRLHLLAVGRLKASAYASEIRKLGMQQRVRFVGPTSEVADYYSAADVFALPTQYEAWGLVIVEALACGLPVLTSRLAGASIAINEGKTGRLLNDPRDPAEIASHLEELVDGQHAEADAIAASVASYAWSNILAQFEAMLLETAGRSNLEADLVAGGRL